jgi:hypothetical protein
MICECRFRNADCKSNRRGAESKGKDERRTFNAQHRMLNEIQSRFLLAVQC